MKNLFSLFNNNAQEDPPEHNAEQLTQESTIKSLEMEIFDRDQTIARLTSELTRLRDSQQKTVEDLIEAKFKDLFEEIAPQISQLQTQRYLVCQQEKPLPPRHIFTILDQMHLVLSKYGLEIADNVGETVSFNPDHHAVLSRKYYLSTGDTVIIRFPGLYYRGQRIRKAGVEPVEAQE